MEKPTLKLCATAIPFPSPAPKQQQSSRPVELGPASQSSPPSTEGSNPFTGLGSPRQQQDTPQSLTQDSRTGAQQDQEDPIAAGAPVEVENALGISLNAADTARSAPPPAPLPHGVPTCNHPLPPRTTHGNHRAVSMPGAFSPPGQPSPMPQGGPRPGGHHRSASHFVKGYGVGFDPCFVPVSPQPFHPHPHHGPPGAIHHHHSFPSLPHFAQEFVAPPSPFPFFHGPPRFPSPSPAAFSSPATPQLAPVGPPLRHQPSYYASSVSSHPFEISNGAATPSAQGFPPSPPNLDLPSPSPAGSSGGTTCDVWDCFSPSTCEISPCSCVLCPRHLRIVLHGAKVVEVGAKEAGMGKQLKKLFECVACRTRSQALGKEAGEASGLGECPAFDIGAFGVRDLTPPSSLNGSHSPSPPPPPPPRKVTLASSIAPPAFPIAHRPASIVQKTASPDAPPHDLPTPSLSTISEPPAGSTPSPVPHDLASTPQPTAPEPAPARAPSPPQPRQVLSVSNLPWEWRIQDVEEWLPEDCRPLTIGPSPSIYFVVHRRTHRTMSRCYIENLTAEQARRITAECGGKILVTGRPVNIVRVQPSELMRALFDQPVEYMRRGFPSTSGPTPLSLPSAEERDKLLEACFLTAKLPGSHTPIERPFLNVVQLTAKFPWSDTAFYTLRDVDEWFATIFEAASYAVHGLKTNEDYFPLIQRLKEVVWCTSVFSESQKHRIGGVEHMALPFMKRANVYQEERRPRASSSSSSSSNSGPTSPNDFRPRRASLLGPHGQRRRAQGQGTASPITAFPPLTFDERRLPLSPPETPEVQNHVQLTAAPQRKNRKNSAGAAKAKAKAADVPSTRN